MGTYPWGPHGPQAGAHDVTPNPTPAYVPPPSDFGGDSDWGTPAPSTGGGGGYSGGGGGGYAGPTGPHLKSKVLAVILALILGPLGLLYASWRGALLIFTVMLGYPVALVMTGHPPGYYDAGMPLSIWGNDLVMTPLWRNAVVVSVVWAVIAVLRYNRKSKANWKGTH